MEYKFSSQDIQIDERGNTLTNITDSSFRNNTCFIGDWFDISREKEEAQTLKFAINNLSSPSCFFVGIAVSDEVTNDLMVECCDTTYAYCGNGRLYLNNTEHKTVDDCQDNDTLELTLYPDDLTLRLIINDAHEIVLFEDIMERKYRFAISLCFAGDSLTILNEKHYDFETVDTPKLGPIANIYNDLSVIHTSPSGASSSSLSPSAIAMKHKLHNCTHSPTTSSTTNISMRNMSSETHSKNNDNNNNNPKHDTSSSDTNCDDCDNTEEAVEDYEGLCGIHYIRRVTMSLSIFIITSLSFALWFTTTHPAAFTVAYIVSGCGASILCVASLISFIRCMITMASFEYIPFLFNININMKLSRVPVAIAWLYMIGSVVYLMGGCAVVDVYNKYGLSHYAAIWFAEQAFIALYGMICAMDVGYRHYLNDKKYRVMLYNANIILLSVILFFGYAVSCTMVESAGAILLSLFYFFLIVVNAMYLVFVWREKVQYTMQKATVALALAIMHFVCILGVCVGYLVLVKQVMAIYKSYWIGFAAFMFVNGSVMSLDMYGFEPFIAPHDDEDGEDEEKEKKEENINSKVVNVTGGNKVHLNVGTMCDAYDATAISNVNEQSSSSDDDERDSSEHELML